MDQFPFLAPWLEECEELLQRHRSSDPRIKWRAVEEFLEGFRDAFFAHAEEDQEGRYNDARLLEARFRTACEMEGVPLDVEKTMKHTIEAILRDCGRARAGN